MIDLNQQTQIQIPFTSIISNQTQPFSSSSSPSSSKATIIKTDQNRSFTIKYSEKTSSSLHSSAIISISPPFESRQKSKAKTNKAYIDINTTFNTEQDKSKQVIFNSFLKNLCSSLIKEDDYPRCVISIGVNVLSFQDEFYLKRLLVNGIVLGLSVSNISMNCLCFAFVFEKEAVICVDNDEKIVFAESEKGVSFERMKEMFEFCVGEYSNQYFLYKKNVVNICMEV